MFYRRSLPLMLCVLVTSCHGDNIFGPSSSGDIRKVWSPYVGVHPFNGGRDQVLYLEKMIQAGVLKGVRVDWDNQDGGRELSLWLDNRGVEVIGVFPNEYLRNSDAANIFLSQVSGNPQIRHWEIGNEVELFVPMTPEEYVPIFLNIYQKVKPMFPDVEIIPQAIVGASFGSPVLGKMLDLGIEALARHPDPAYRLNFIVVHYYSIQSPFVYEAKKQIDRMPAHVQVWVTETGINDWNMHIQHVLTEYPRMRKLLRASRIYWYVLSEACEDWSLVKGLSNGCVVPPTTSPLYDALIGGIS